MEIKIRNWQREQLAEMYGPEYIANKSVDELAAIWAEQMKGNQLEAVKESVTEQPEQEPKKSKKIRI